MDDEYLALLSRLQMIGYVTERRLRTLGVTGCRSREGATTVAARLAALASASMGANVLLVDANLARPSLHRLFRIHPHPGLLDALTDAVALEECVQPTGSPNLWLVPAGVARGAGYEQVSLLRAMRQLLPVAAEFDFVVVDLPAAERPVPLVSLVADLDGVLLVVEAERTPQDIAERAKRELTEAGANLLGAVLNKRRRYLPKWLEVP